MDEVCTLIRYSPVEETRAIVLFAGDGAAAASASPGRPAWRCTAASFKSRVTSVVVSGSATKTLLSPQAPKLDRRAGQVDAVMAWNCGDKGRPGGRPLLLFDRLDRPEARDPVLRRAKPVLRFRRQ